ncbi:protein of unknown function DUF900, hydrolase family protein [Nostoc sp. HK-01]|nr:protein of unknown function DUF900, hydrolase family protein [Nostoc sp. HK-01]
MTDSNSKEPYFCAYTVTSTAKSNVEDDKHNSQEIWEIKCLQRNSEVNIQDIAKKLDNNGKKSELIIAVHGYSQGKEEPFWHKGIFDYFSKNTRTLENDEDKKYVFLGYRWPSEKPLLGNNFVSMPGTILGLLLFLGFFILSFLIILLVSAQKNQSVVPKDSDVYFLWIVVSAYIVVSCFLLSHRHQHNNPCIEWVIDGFLWVLSGGLFFGFLHILHSQYNHSFLLLISIALSIALSILLLVILQYSKALDLLAPTLPVSLCIVIAVEFLSIQPFEPILRLLNLY